MAALFAVLPPMPRFHSISNDNRVSISSRIYMEKDNKHNNIDLHI